MKRILVITSMLIVVRFVKAQDPSFSQFFSSPLNINPALTARINSDWRVISNFRDQWIGPASPYATGTISYDTKALQNKIPNVHEEKNILGIGGMLMYDYAMDGIMKSTYGSANLSYNIVLANGPVVHRLGVGFGGTYGRRTVDFSRLTWEEQWVGYSGFNTNLPSGEAALSNMKPYFSLSLAMRKVIHANFETYLNNGLVLNTNAIYQFQDEAKYYSFGAGFGYYLPDNPDVILNAGLWYWSKNAVIPYIGFAYKDFQLGLSYDLTISKLDKASIKPKTFELSLIFRGIKEPTQIIPCPWK